jgi:hypothetical protein
MNNFLDVHNGTLYTIERYNCIVDVIFYINDNFLTNEGNTINKIYLIKDKSRKSFKEEINCYILDRIRGIYHNIKVQPNNTVFIGYYSIEEILKHIVEKKRTVLSYKEMIIGNRLNGCYPIYIDVDIIKEKSNNFSKIIYGDENE